MVGDPKHLSDLAKIEADVRITCSRCRFEQDWTREELSKHLRSIGGSLVWSEITRHLKCRRFGCGLADLRAQPVPFARRPPNLPRAIDRLDARLIATALGILDEAVLRARGASVATPAVQLAVLVLHAYARDAAAARLFWERAGVAARTVNDGLTEPLELLKYRLQQRGWLAPTMSAPDQLPTWPWPSPAPPGYLPAAGYPRTDELKGQ